VPVRTVAQIAGVGFLHQNIEELLPADLVREREGRGQREAPRRRQRAAPGRWRRTRRVLPEPLRVDASAATASATMPAPPEPLAFPTDALVLAELRAGKAALVPDSVF